MAENFYRRKFSAIHLGLSCALTTSKTRVSAATRSRSHEFGSRDQTPRPFARLLDMTARSRGGGGGGGHDQEMLNVDVERSFRETCAFFRGHSLYVGCFVFMVLAEASCRLSLFFLFLAKLVVACLSFFLSERSTCTVMRYLPFGCSVMEENLIDLLWPGKRPRHRRRSLLRRALSDPALRSALLCSPRLFWSLHPTPVTQRSFWERNVQGRWILQSCALFAFLFMLSILF